MPYDSYSIEEYRQLQAQLSKPKSKMGNTPTKVDGIRFHSKAEAMYYGQLLLLQKAGEVTHFLMQVPFMLEGGVRYYLDFLVFYASGRIEYIDVKGFKTKIFVMKKKQVEARYPIEIKCLKRVGGKFKQIDA